MSTLGAAAAELRERHAVSEQAPRPLPSWQRLDALGAWLRRARRTLATPSPATEKAAEWLLDNDYLVDRALRQIGRDLPPGFYARLPSLTRGEQDGLPRVFAIAEGMLDASHLQLSLTVAVEYVNAYQEEGAWLTIAELWALPTMLRLACLELLTATLVRLLPEVAAHHEPPALTIGPVAFEDTECVVRALTNLRTIATLSWKEFFVRTSRVETVLRDDPAGVYARMDFETRDRYRRAVERLARGARCAEWEVAARAVAAAHGPQPDAREGHVGYWLIADGRPVLEERLGYRPAAAERVRRWAARRVGPLYALTIALVTTAMLAVPACGLVWAHASPWITALGLAVALLPASALGVAIVQWLTTLVVPPRVLPKIDCEVEIPPDCGTVVVVPAIVRDAVEATRLVECLEAHALANPRHGFRYVLLTDHTDAPDERMPGDEAVIDALVAGVRALNTRHVAGDRTPFHLLHRARSFDASEGCWMGRERKRGKLEDFNRFVLDGTGDAFVVQEGASAALRGTRFVVTVDADTRLPPGSVARLVGTLTHPLNRAVIDPATNRVVAGYALVQPRIEITPESSHRSLFAGLYAGDTTIDPYSSAVSDVYQDLFGCAIYVGKGIYEVAAFHRTLAGRVPRDALVSHDLFEGLHGRVALASDVVLYEEFPADYAAYARRLHRWIRGDWQLLPWLGRRVPGEAGPVANRFSRLDRWKIVDNLRRSLVPPALLAMLALGWLVLPRPLGWTLLAILVPGSYLFIDLVAGMTRGRRRGILGRALQGPRERVGRWALELAFLPHAAVVALDAIVRTLWRLTVSRRRLLEWTTAAHTAARLAGRDRRTWIWREMWSAPALAAVLFAAIVWWRPAALACAAPLLLVWAVAPAIAAGISRPRARATAAMTAADRTELRQLARRTWLFFETFVGPEDHWLPPDNYQEDPRGEIAHRTSPTNVGMLLLSSLVACDLGYLGLPEIVVRLRETLDALGKLEHYRGHLLNWYDTRTLDPLEPRYVSTVDSGNLAASLLATQQGCLELACGTALRPALWDGVRDLLGLLRAALADVGDRRVGDRLAAIADTIDRGSDAETLWRHTLPELCERACPEIAQLVTAAIAPHAPEERLREIRVWMERLHHHLRTMERDRERLAPWLGLLAHAPADRAAVARRVRETLPVTLALAAIPAAAARARALLREAAISDAAEPTRTWQEALDAALGAGATEATALRDALLSLAAAAETQALAMDFGLCFDPQSHLLHIGYNVSADRLDPHHYDLMATEARIASFIAVAKGDVPLEHWFHLGRPLARTPEGLTILSWGGSMFEYLMPTLLLGTEPGTLVGTSEQAAVGVQRRHGERLGVPWGVSESGFASLDHDHHYRYRAFGVPGLGIRRGLARDIVVAPYATALALGLAPAAAMANLRRLAALGAQGCYGFYEAVDFTAERLPTGRTCAIVRSYMCHHQGMILAAIGNRLSDEALVRRFRSHGMMRAAELLLHERVPRDVPLESMRVEESPRPPTPRVPLPPPRSWAPLAPALVPQTHFLGNGRLASWISDAGSGGLSWQGHALTRWHADLALDEDGLWIYVRDEDSGEVWSATRQPTGVAADDARVVFHPHAAEFHRRDHGVALVLDVGVATADDVEMRRLTVVNESDRPRRLVITSYGEVVLQPTRDDERHPAFGKLFVRSEHLPELDALLFTRRPRHPDERPPVLLHRVLSADGAHLGARVETDRRAFVGRHGGLRRPQPPPDAEGALGWTLDPVLSLAVRLALEPHERREIAFVTVAAGSRESALETAERYATVAAVDWAIVDAAHDSTRHMRELGLDPALLPEVQQLGAALLHPHRTPAPAETMPGATGLGQPGLWALGISGDLPILLLRVEGAGESTLLPSLVRAQQWWRRHGLTADLVVLRSGVSGYAEPIRERLFDLLRDAGIETVVLGHAGGVHLVFADQISAGQQAMLLAAARVVLDDAAGTLARQLETLLRVPAEQPRFEPTVRVADRPPTPPWPRPDDLRFDCGFGGFSPDGREYVIYLAPGEHTPAPWSNVLANDAYGSVVTEAGGGFTWAANSGEHRLTPWMNDPVRDPVVEAIYLRDEETAELWTPTPQPAGGGAACEIRHGAGSTEWRRRCHGFEQHLRVFVPSDDPVKIARLRLRNLLDRPRRVTATFYVEWLLGALASAARALVQVEYEPTAQVALARNPWSPEFADRVAFAATNRPLHGLTFDRREFFGREGSRAEPAALRRWGLAGCVEAPVDPCAALQVHLDVAVDATVEVVFLLGEGRDRAEALALADRWRAPEAATRGFAIQQREWDRRLGAVQVRTPDAAFDLLVNRWLLYQTVASRILARAGYHQAGGAIGFRDQLQDVLALLHVEPARTRAHILTCAAHQFEEGDVLHWWHPVAERGVRTRCSDDLLWLPYAVSLYVESTGDLHLLDEEVPFLQAAPLGPGENDRYARFDPGGVPRSLFEHCERALERGVTRGAHGLCLMQAGDWNDGMNRVGAHGRGESVWLTWFASATAKAFAAVCARRGQGEIAARWRRRAEELDRAADTSAWDGAWYVRAFDDAGRPWGSSGCEECRIDSIAQSWAVLAGAAPAERAERALAAAARELVVADARLVRLLWPPFDTTPRDPGYIKAYPPGVRENGGQYTHAAAWLAWAFAERGDGARAGQLFALLNPILRVASRSAAEQYGVEPYVLPADIAATPPHEGRGGWTWYTGSAAWTWRLAVEAILGLRRRNGRLVVDPCLPPAWGGFEAELVSSTGRLAVRVDDPEHVGTGVVAVTVDGESAAGAIAFPTDGSLRRVEVRLGRARSETAPPRTAG